MSEELSRECGTHNIHLARFPYNPVLHYAFRSWIKESRGKTTDFLWDYGFVFYLYGVIRKSFQLSLLLWGIVCGDSARKSKLRNLSDLEAVLG